MKQTLRRAATLVAAPALAAAALVAAGTAPAAAAGTDTGPGVAAGAWLAQQAPDYGTFQIGNTIDQALALEELGGHDATVEQIAAGVADNLAAYTDYSYCNDFTEPYEAPPCDTTELIEGVSAGAVSKALVGMRAGDVDVTEVLAKLESLIPDAGDLAGRAISPQTSDGAPAESGYTNVIGQTFAVRGLAGGASDETAAAAEFLTGLQCSDGSFMEDLPAENVAQTCEATTFSSKSVDATALAVLALDAVGTPAADTAIANAATWLTSVQQKSGGFGSDGTGQSVNANSTGLATQALGRVGASVAAAKGATWVRQHQIHLQDPCAPVSAGDSGAIAYDDSARDAALTGGITEDAYGTWLRASAQAAPALLWAPQGDGGDVLFTAEYVKAGGSKQVGVVGADPGEQLCAQAGGQRVVRWANAAGAATFPVTVPAKTATTSVHVYAVDAKVGTARIKALGAKKLPLSLKAKVRTGAKQTVKVRGLAPGESVTVKVLGRTKRGQATAKGVFTTSVKATGKQARPGRSKVTVKGQFGTRTGSKTFKVVR